GGDRNRTGVRGFAGLCLTTRPPRRTRSPVSPRPATVLDALPTGYKRPPTPLGSSHGTCSPSVHTQPFTDAGVAGSLSERHHEECEEPGRGLQEVWDPRIR